MAKSFNLTAELNLRGPANLKTVVADIKRQLATVNGNINLKVDPAGGKNIAIIVSKINAMNKALIVARQNTDNLGNALKNLSSSLGTIQSSGSSSASSLNSTNAAMSSITKTTAQATSKMEEFGKQSALAIKRFAAFSFVSTGIYALLNAITSGTKAFIEFDSQIVKLQQVTGKSKAGLADLANEITRLSTTLGVSSASLIDVASTLAQAGFNANDTRIALEALAKTELAPSFDNISETAEGAIAAIRQFGLQASELESALGSINAVAAAFAVESADIISAIQRTGGVFAAASKGVSEGTDALNEFVAVFTSVRATTRESAETIATGLRTIFTRIQRVKTIDQLKQFGIELTDIEGKFVGPYEAVKRLSEGLKSLDPRDIRFSSIVEELGGFRQIGKVIPLIQQFATAQEALKIAQRGQDSLTAAQITAQQSLAVQLSKVREQFLALIRDVGQSTAFQNLFKIVTNLASGLISLVSTFKPILPLLGLLGAIKGVGAVTKFASGFIGGLNKGGGAGGAGQNLGSSISGSKEKERADATAKVADALRSNTDALKNLTSSVNALNNTITSKGTTGLNSGGPVKKFARGGVVPGSGNRDTVPAMLTPGEFVIRKKAVETIGTGNLHKINKYAGGGKVFVDYPDEALTTKTIDSSLATAINSVGKQLSPTNKNVKSSTARAMPNYAGVVGSIFEAGLARASDEKYTNDRKAFDFPSGINVQTYSKLKGITSDAKRNFNVNEDYYKDNIYNKIGNTLKDSISSSNQNFGVAVMNKGTDTSFDWSPELVAGAKAKRKNLGGIIQRFKVGGKALGSRSKIKELDDSELAQLSTKDLIAYAKKQAYDIFSTAGAGMAIGSEFIEVPPERIVPELEDDLKTYMGKKGFWREIVAPFGSPKKQSAKSISKIGREAALAAQTAKQSDEVAAREQQWTSIRDGSAIDKYLFNTLQDPILSDYKTVRGGGSLAKAFHNTRLRQAVNKALEEYDDFDYSGKNLDKLISNFAAKQMATGGFVKKFMAGGVAQYGSIDESILQRIKALGGPGFIKTAVPGELADAVKASGIRTSGKLLDSRSLKAMPDSARLAPFLEKVLDAAEGVKKGKETAARQQLDNNMRAAAGGAYQFGLVSLFGPNGELGYSSMSDAKELTGKNGEKFLTQIVRKSLPQRYESAIQSIQKDVAGVASRGAERIQYTDIFGSKGPLAFDFDDTLVKNADIFAPNGGIDIRAYNDLNKVKESLKNAQLTLLGQELSKRLSDYPQLMDSIRVLTARPQSNAPLLAAKLKELNLPIPENKITGVSGGLNKVENLSELETLIDDNLENIQAVLGAGKKAYKYSEPKGINLADTSSRKSMAAMEGYALEEIVKSLGVKISPDDYDPNRPIDYPKGLGGSAGIWGIKSTLPTDTKRTNDSSALSRLWGEAQRYFVEKFASGGQAGISSKDTVPALLTPGEFVINKKAAKRIGYAKLEKLNKADKVQGFNKGGGVGNIQKFGIGGGVQAEQFDFFAYKAKEAGYSVEKFQRILAKEASNLAKSLRIDLKAKQTDLKFTSVNIGSDIKGRSRTGSDEDKSFIAKAEEILIQKLKDINPEKPLKEIEVAAASLVDKLIETDGSFEAAAESVDLVKESMLKTPDAIDAVGDAIKLMAQKTGIATDILTNIIGEDVAARQTSMGEFKANLKDTIKDLGGPIRLVGIGMTIVSSQISKLIISLDASTKENAALMATFGAITGGAQGAVAGQIIGKEGGDILGRLFPKIDGLGKSFEVASTAVGLFIGAVNGAANAYYRSRLDKILNDVAKSGQQVDAAFEALAKNNNVENFDKAQKALRDGATAIMDTMSMANLGAAGTNRTILEWMRSLSPIDISGGATEKEARAQAFDQVSQSVARAMTLGENRMTRVRLGDIQQNVDKTQEIDTKIKQAKKDNLPDEVKRLEKEKTDLLATTSQVYGQLRQIYKTENDAFKALFIEQARRSGMTDEQINEALKPENIDETIQKGKELSAMYAEQEQRARLLSDAVRSLTIEGENILNVLRLLDAGLTRFAENIEEIKNQAMSQTSALKGQASIRVPQRIDQQILENISGFSPEAVAGAATRAAQLAGGGKAGEDLANRVNSAKFLQDKLPNILQNTTATSAEEVLKEIQAQLPAGLTLDNAVLGELTRVLENKLLGKEDGTTIAEIANDPEILGTITKIAEASTKSAASIVRAFYDAMSSAIDLTNEYGKSLEEITDLQLKSVDIRARAELELADALGQYSSLDQMNAPFDARIRGLSSSSILPGGSTDPEQLQKALTNLVAERGNAEQELARRMSAVGSAQNPQDRAAAEQQVKEQLSLMAEQNTEINNTRKALEELANDSSAASNALKKLSDYRAATKAGVNLAQEVLTADPDKLRDINKQLRAYTKVISGQATGKEIANVQFRQQAFGGLDMLRSVMPERIAQQMQARMSRQMLSSMGVDLGQTIAIGPDNQAISLDQALTNVETGKDPQQEAYIEAYRQATERQAKAAEALAAAATAVAFNFEAAAQKIIDAFSKPIQGIPGVTEQAPGLAGQLPAATELGKPAEKPPEKKGELPSEPLVPPIPPDNAPENQNKPTFEQPDTSGIMLGLNTILNGIALALGAYTAAKVFKEFDARFPKQNKPVTPSEAGAAKATTPKAPVTPDAEGKVPKAIPDVEAPKPPKVPKAGVPEIPKLPKGKGAAGLLAIAAAGLGAAAGYFFNQQQQNADNTQSPALQDVSTNALLQQILDAINKCCVCNCNEIPSEKPKEIINTNISQPTQTEALKNNQVTATEAAATSGQQETRNAVLDWSQFGLSIAGLIPVVGELADVANAAIYAARAAASSDPNVRNDLAVDAGLSAASAIPIAGYAANAVKGGKMAAAATGVGVSVAQSAAANAAAEAIREQVVTAQPEQQPTPPTPVPVQKYQGIQQQPTPQTDAIAIKKEQDISKSIKEELSDNKCCDKTTGLLDSILSSLNNKTINKEYTGATVSSQQEALSKMQQQSQIISTTPPSIIRQPTNIQETTPSNNNSISRLLPQAAQQAIEEAINTNQSNISGRATKFGQRAKDAAQQTIDAANQQSEMISPNTGSSIRKDPQRLRRIEELKKKGAYRVGPDGLPIGRNYNEQGEYMKLQSEEQQLLQSTNPKRAAYLAAKNQRRQAYLSRFRPDVRQTMLTADEKAADRFTHTTTASLSRNKFTEPLFSAAGTSQKIELPSSQPIPSSQKLPTAQDIQTKTEQTGATSSATTYTLTLDQKTTQFLTDLTKTVSTFGNYISQLETVSANIPNKIDLLLVTEPIEVNVRLTGAAVIDELRKTPIVLKELVDTQITDNINREISGIKKWIKNVSGTDLSPGE